MMRLRLLFFVAFLASTCAHTPPSLSPPAQIAWQQHEIQKDLDMIRDIAQDANAQHPPLISTPATRQITLWHKTAITLVHDAPAGWRVTVMAGLEALRTNLAPNEYRIIAPYVGVAQLILKNIQP